MQILDSAEAIEISLIRPVIDSERLKPSKRLNSTARTKTLPTKIALLAIISLSTTSFLAAQQTAITTSHYNNLRTGWNNTETVLTPANVNSSAFGMLYSIALDAQIDAQPLYVPNQLITAGSYQGTYDVVYVASENNTIYAIDANSGQIL